MNCGKYNFVVKRGATKVFTVEYTNSSGSIIPLNNYSASMQFRTDIDSAPSLTLSSTGSNTNNSKLTITPSSGSIRVYISAADTNLLTDDSYFYDLELYTAADPYSQSDPQYVIRLLEGLVTTTYNITR